MQLPVFPDILSTHFIDSFLQFEVHLDQEIAIALQVLVTRKTLCLVKGERLTVEFDCVRRFRGAGTKMVEDQNYRFRLLGEGAGGDPKDG